MTVAPARLRALFAIPHLARGGGAERVMLTLLQHLDRSRFEPQLLVLDASRNEIAAELPADVPLIDLGVSRVRYAARPIMAALRRVQPDVLLSGLGHLNLMISMMRPLLPRRLAVVGRETAVVTAFNAEFRSRALRDLAYRWFYPRLDSVVCQSEDMRDDLVGHLGFDAARTRLIPNPVDVGRVGALAAREEPACDALLGPPGPLRLVAVGRLMPQKGFDLLIDAVAQLARGSYRLVIVGDGPERAALEARIAALAIQDDVRLAGYQANPYAFMKRADALVLSSRYEGLPNVILESLALGTPAIAMPCPGGTREIAARTGGVTLAESVSADALAAAIVGFVRQKAAGIAAPIVIDDYRVDAVVARYEAALTDAVRIARAR